MNKFILISSQLFRVGFRRISQPVNSVTQCRYFSLSSSKYDLMKFFDDPANWGESKISRGRPWRMDELRLKSNKELHQLWYILLKERNMLMTMAEEYCYQNELYSFPSPERLEKVEETMENLIWVVEERNKAVAELEEGSWNGPSIVEDMDKLGRPGKRLTSEHVSPYSENVGDNELMWSAQREQLLREEREHFMRNLKAEKEQKIIEEKKRKIKEEDTVKAS